MRRSQKFLDAMDAYDSNQPGLALQLMEECARNDDPVACFTTALWYHSGEGVPVNGERSAKWLARLEELATAGIPEAQWEIGQHYRFGNLFPLNIELANTWLEQAAKNGHPEAQHHLGWYLESGQYNYAVDTAAAAIWYQRAFKQEHPETLYLFAVRQFQNGQPTVEAVRLLRKASDNGFAPATEVLRAYTH